MISLGSAPWFDAAGRGEPSRGPPLCARQSPQNTGPDKPDLGLGVGAIARLTGTLVIIDRPSYPYLLLVYTLEDSRGIRLLIIPTLMGANTAVPEIWRRTLVSQCLGRLSRVQLSLSIRQPSFATEAYYVIIKALKP